MRLCQPSERPKRDTVIQEDEIVDLVITLNITEDVLEFLNDIGVYV